MVHAIKNDEIDSFDFFDHYDQYCINVFITFLTVQRGGIDGLASLFGHF